MVPELCLWGLLYSRALLVGLAIFQSFRLCELVTVKSLSLLRTRQKRALFARSRALNVLFVFSTGFLLLSIIGQNRRVFRAFYLWACIRTRQKRALFARLGALLVRLCVLLWGFACGACYDQKGQRKSPWFFMPRAFCGACELVLCRFKY
jgi:hypothetical protein